MKREKDGEKVMEPMFPRLHVKDTEKGGPRAPPRNKMALYEQLSIPSHRISQVVLPGYSKNTTVPPMSQVGQNDRSMFLSGQLPPRHLSEQQYRQYSDLSTLSAQVGKRKKLDEDDYRVPVFNHSISSHDMNQENLLPTNTHCFTHSQKAKETGTIGHDTRQEDKTQKENNSQESMAGWVKSISFSSSVGKSVGPRKQNFSSLSCERGDKPGNSIDRLKTNDSLRAELCADSQPCSDECIITEENMAAVERTNSPNMQENMHDFSNDTESNELDRGDSVSETSILDTISTADVTPDDIVGIIGQEHFWKARRAIANQQRVFAVQVFELHRLIKVQKLIAASPHILLEDSAYLGKHTKPLPGKKPPVRAIPNQPKRKDDLEKPKDKKEGSAKSTVEKAPYSAAQNGVPVAPANCQPVSSNSQEPSIASGDHQAKPWCYNQPQGHQWLVPVISPSEGLIYKPYPGPGFMDQACGGCGPPGSIPMMGDFFTPAYGIPAPPAQYQLPSFPPVTPHGYFPPYSMPMMNTAALSGSSVEQTSQKNRTVADTVNSNISEDIEVQASTASSPSERRHGSRAMERRNMLPLFPTSPVINTSKPGPQVEAAPERPTGVIRVVPHNAITASESAARIFRAIQEGRKQYDSV